MRRNSTILYSLNNADNNQNFVIDLNELIDVELDKDIAIRNYLNSHIYKVNDKVLESIYNYSKSDIV